MKKTCAFTLVLCLILLFSSALAEENILGGWTPYAGDPTEIPQEALDALEKAVNGSVGCEIEPVALLATQLVSGTNYCFLCRETVVAPNAAPEYVLNYVYCDLEGNCSFLHTEKIVFSASGE